MGMTREEAIAEIKYYMESDSYADAPSNEACKMAINALRPVSREQVERMWKGEWIAVTESEITGFNPEFAGCDPIGGYKCSRCKAEAALDCNDEFVLGNFCPVCGAPMTDEAVEMVMERMEVIWGE